MYRQVPSVRTK